PRRDAKPLNWRAAGASQAQGARPFPITPHVRRRHCQGNGDYLLSGVLPAKGRSDFAELFAPAGPLKTDKNTLYLVALTVPGGRASWRPPGLDLAAIANVAV